MELWKMSLGIDTKGRNNRAGNEAGKESERNFRQELKLRNTMRKK